MRIGIQYYFECPYCDENYSGPCKHLIRVIKEGETWYAYFSDGNGELSMPILARVVERKTKSDGS